MNKTQEDFRKEQADLYERYRVKLHVNGPLCGGVPKNPELIRAWVEANTGHKDKLTEQMTEEAIAAVLDTTTEKSWNGFKADEHHGIYLEPRQVKAMFKEAASMLRITVKKIGSKQVLQHGFFIRAVDGGMRIYVGKTKADGFEESPIHVTTPQGPRSALKRVDYVSDVDVEFVIHVMHTSPQDKRHLGEKEIRQMLAFSMRNGLGADRSQDKGQFEVVDFEKLPAI